jgi:hydrophobic/amphiphilic exporter-1 (mainly G- bacteria), HAE1 family
MNALKDYETAAFKKINPAVKFSVNRYVLAIGIFVAIVAFGFICTLSLGVDLLPAVNVPTVNVSISYPGASPSVVDQQITQIVENAVSSLSGITDLNSTSSIGSSRVSIAFGTDTDKNVVLNQVASLVNAAVRRLPTGINPPVVRSFDSSSQPIIQFGISGGGASLVEVADYIQNSLVTTLELVPGVANVTVDGAPSRQFQVLLDPNKIKFYGITPTQVVSAIVGAAVNQPIGSITTKGNSITFSTQNVPAGLDALRRMLVDSSRGVSVSDLGTVRDASVDTNYARINGIPVVLVSVQRTTDSNSVAVVDGVRKLLSRTSLPSGYTLGYSIDSTGPIRASIDNTFHELLMTILVVGLIVLLFLGKPNTAFSVILAVPIALSAAPILYKLAGFSFNLVSLLALVTAIGIVVDDSIVVAENVERNRGLGLSLKDAVLKGASEVFSAVVAASLSLLAVLLPVSFIGGYIGRYLQQFSLGLAAAVLFSLLEAILFLTVRLAYMKEAKELGWKDFVGSFGRLPKALKWGLSTWRKAPGLIGLALIAGAIVYFRRYALLACLLGYPLALGLGNYLVFAVVSLLEALTGTLHGWTESFVSVVQEAYARSLRGTLKRSAPVLVATTVILGGVALLIAPRIPINFIPQSDAGTLSVNLRFPAGTPQSVVNAATSKVESFMLRRPEVDTVQAIAGSSGEVDANLVPVGKRPSVFSLAQTYRRALQPILIKDTPSVRLSVGTGGGMGPGGGSSLQLSVVSADMDLLTKRNAAILASIQRIPGVADVSSSLSDTSLENDFIPDPAKLKGTGITPQAVATALQTYASGVQASNVVTGGLSYPIYVMVDPTALGEGQNLLDMPLYSSTLQTSLQVGQLGKFVLNEAPVSIVRYNRQYADTFTMNLDKNAPTALEMQKSITAELSRRGLLDGGLSVTSTSRFGQAALASQLSSSGPQIFLLAFFLAYLVMAAQFNSWRYPIYLLLPVPFALIGALILVWAIGGGLDIFGLMGMIMLIGLSAKNAILYLDFVVERLGTMPIEEALVEAARLRFRPIVMTTLTVLVISFPLVFSGGQGAEFGQRMGIVMFGGIVFSAVLTFFVVPAAFYQFERKRAVPQKS